MSEHDQQESQCDRVQELVADFGAAALERDAQAREHLAGCPYCERVLAALAEVDAALPALPRDAAPSASVDRVRAAATARAAVVRRVA